MNTARINKGRLIIVIVIGIIVLRSLVSIWNFLLTENKTTEVNKNVSVVKETSTSVITNTPNVTEKQTKKPIKTKKESINENTTTLIGYNNWAKPKVTKLTNIFNDLTLHSTQNDLTAVLNDFNKLFKIEKQFVNKEYPEEFTTFRYNMLQMFLKWHEAKDSLIINDSAGISTHGAEANNYLNLATKEYKKIMGLDYE